MKPDPNRAPNGSRQKYLTTLNLVGYFMQIQWFPGHMNKARNEVKAIIPKVDLLIEVLDARIPYSSENPMIRQLRGATPALKLLAKSDLANSKLTDQWLDWHNQRNGIQAKAVSTKNRSGIKEIPNTLFDLLPEEKRNRKSLLAMIAGVPNVGKSTLINILAGRTVAKTGNEPAVTKGQQKIVIGNGITLLDTPGMLWPKVENPKSGLRLAAVGSVKDTAMEYEDVAAFIVNHLLKHRPEVATDFYQFDSPALDMIDFFDRLGQKRGCLGKSGVVDYERVSRIIVTDFRKAALGKITLETPEEIQKEIADLEIELARKSDQKEAKKAARKARFKARNKNRNR